MRPDTRPIPITEAQKSVRNRLAKPGASTHDLYDERYEYCSPDPTDPTKTRRVLTIVFAEDH